MAKRTTKTTSKDIKKGTVAKTVTKSSKKGLIIGVSIAAVAVVAAAITIPLVLLNKKGGDKECLFNYTTQHCKVSELNDAGELVDPKEKYKENEVVTFKIIPDKDYTLPSNFERVTIGEKDVTANKSSDYKYAIDPASGNVTAVFSFVNDISFTIVASDKVYITTASSYDENVIKFSPNYATRGVQYEGEITIDTSTQLSEDKILPEKLIDITTAHYDTASKEYVAKSILEQCTYDYNHEEPMRMIAELTIPADAIEGAIVITLSTEPYSTKGTYTEIVFFRDNETAPSTFSFSCSSAENNPVVIDWDIPGEKDVTLETGDKIEVTSPEFPVTDGKYGYYVRIYGGLDKIKFNKSSAPGCGSISKIKLGQSVKTIVSGAFYGMNLLSIDLGKVETIEFLAFNGLGLISELNIPETVTLIQNCVDKHYSNAGSPFLNCPKLTSLKVNKSSEHYTTVDENNIELNMIYTKANGKADKLIYGLGNGTILPTVTTIYEYTFSGAHDFPDNFVLPNSVTSIGSFSFHASQIKQITLPAGVTEIPSQCFFSARSLHTINTVSAGQITKVRYAAFETANNLKNFDMSGLIEIGGEAFWSVHAMDVFEIPSSCTTIGANAFHYVGAGSQSEYGSTMIEIHVPFKENEIPSGWNTNWSGDIYTSTGGTRGAKIVYAS